MNTYAVAIFGALALGACEETPSIVATDAPTDILNAEERFELAYIGRWSESGACSGAEMTWEISDNLIRAGERFCSIADVDSKRSRLGAKLEECVADGEPIPDRQILLDVAGDDILYVTTADGNRVRLERCTAT